jgi:hypothetical protein
MKVRKIAKRNSHINCVIVPWNVTFEHKTRDDIINDMRNFLTGWLNSFAPRSSD